MRMEDIKNKTSDLVRIIVGKWSRQSKRKILKDTSCKLTVYKIGQWNAENRGTYKVKTRLEITVYITQPSYRGTKLE
jgi:hypothetical protein